MGVIQNQFNSALTGLTFLAQQTPQWQRGRDINIAKREYGALQKAQAAQSAAVSQGGGSIVDKAATQMELKKTQKEETSQFLEEHKTVLPNKYAKNLLHKKNVDRHVRNVVDSIQQAEQSAQARQAEINTADTNMTNYIETIKQMREQGIIKSNRQAKGMIYRAGKGGEH